MPTHVVAGGTGALGRAIVSRLLEDGARVAVPYRGEAGWRELRDACGSAEALWGAPAEIADPAAAAAFFDEAARRFGGIDGAVAASGAYAGAGPLHAAPPSEWPQMMIANLDTARAVCGAAIPHLIERGGSVVTVGSRLVQRGGAGAAAYVVSKAAVAALTRVLALEYSDHRIRFNCVLPGTIDTPANRAAMPRAKTQDWTPPGAIARVIAFLLSPESAAVTGAEIPVDGR